MRASATEYKKWKRGSQVKKITEHIEHVVLQGNEKLLPVSAIFGANASGKSNVVEAFRFMATYVIQSFMYGGDSEKEKIEKQIKFFNFYSKKTGEQIVPKFMYKNKYG